jgi:hypothetical protein
MCRTLVAWGRDRTENNMKICSIEVCASLQQKESFSAYDCLSVCRIFIMLKEAEQRKKKKKDTCWMGQRHNRK